MRVSYLHIKKWSPYLSPLLIIFIVIFLTSFTKKAQVEVPFKSIPGSQIIVNGTSNIHDWVMQASSFSCEGTLTLNGERIEELKTLSITLPVTNLKSKDDLMDSRAYKALEAEKFNKITFKLTDATVVSEQKVIKVLGNLSIAGNTVPVTLHVSYLVKGDEITCKGSKTIRMSDYKIKAPSYMLGALKVGDEVTIDFTVKMKI